MATFGTAQSENRIEVCLGHFDAKHKDSQLVLHHRLWNASEDISEQVVVYICMYAQEMTSFITEKDASLSTGSFIRLILGYGFLFCVVTLPLVSSEDAPLFFLIFVLSSCQIFESANSRN